MLMTVGQEGTLTSSSNFGFCKQLAQWNFQQRGVLKIENMRHKRAGSEWTGSNPENYRITDDMEMTADIFEKND